MKLPKIEIAVAVIAHQGRYLIGLRPDGAALAGLCEFPGGKIHRDETPAAAAQREALEETGLAITVEGVHAVVEHEYPHARLRLHFLACKPQDTQRMENLPERFLWVRGDELGCYEFPAANADIVARLRADYAGSKGRNGDSSGPSV
jgi:mutator protein MutT